jgi:hypothetical protein
VRDICTIRHATKNRAEPRVSEHFLCEDDEGVMHIMLWYGSGDAVQVSRSHAQMALSRIGLDLAWVAEKLNKQGTMTRRTQLLERANFVFSTNCYLLRRALYFFDSTLE